ncbi:MAG: hypothetical protein ACT4OX_03825 [Actinomycetota bacterium]
MDMAIDALLAGAARARASFDTAAVAVSGADLPRTPDPDTTATPDATPVTPGIDVAEQLTTMMVASQVHAANTAAMRAAVSTYRAAVDLLAR